ncbi:MAG: sulfur transferase domain-containing protein [Phycisphaerales bacterium]
MPNSKPALALLILPALLLPACASSRHGASHAPQITTGQPIAATPGFYRAGEVAFGGQPELAEFDTFASEGVTTVINLRSQGEMNDLLAEEGLDEAAAIEARGMRYVHIPLGGDDGYEPADVDAFAAAIESANGPVLVHCASGGRARTMWQAYLVTKRGDSLAQAEAITDTVGGSPAPIERLLGREVRPTVGGTLPPAP